MTKSVRSIFNRKFGWLTLILVMLTVTDFYYQGFYLIFVVAFFALIKAPKINNAFDSGLVWCLLFSTSYSLNYLSHADQGLQYFAAYLIAFVPFYLMGKHFVNSFESPKNLSSMLILLGILFGLPGLISVWLDIMKGGFAQFERSIPMFWGGDPVGATGMGAKFIFLMCLSGILLTAGKQIRFFYKIILIAVLLLAVGAVLRIGSRTQLGILFISALFALFLNFKNKTASQNIITLAMLFLILIIVSVNIAFDFDNELFSTFKTRMEDDGAGDLTTGGGRVDLWIESFRLMKRLPFGWSIDMIGYSHNLWMDAYRVGGFISFLFLIGLTLHYLKKLISVVFSSKLNFGLRVVLGTFSLSFFALFFVEPGIDGMFTGFLFFIFLYGVLTTVD